MRSHTEGPWEVLAANDAYCVHVDGVDIAKVKRIGDAQLIVSAPDLLVTGKHLAIKLAEVYRAAGHDPAKCQAIRDFMETSRMAEDGV